MWYGSTRDNIRLVKLDIYITEKCNLRCRRCSSLMQYFDNPQHVEKDVIINGLEKFYDLIGFSGFTAILGGEPTLHPDFPLIIAECAKYRSQMDQLTVTSNGIVLPSDDIIESLIENDIKFNISMYPTFRDKQTQVAEMLQKRGVNAEIFDPCWTDRTQRRNGDGSIFYKYCRHMVAPCVTLRGNQLWYCEFANNVNGLTLHGEYIDLSEPITKDLIYEYLSPEEPFSACKHCSGAYSEIKIDNGAEQCQRPLRWDL